MACRRSNTLRCPEWGTRTARGCDSGEARRSGAEGARRKRGRFRQSLRQKDRDDELPCRSPGTDRGEGVFPRPMRRTAEPAPRSVFCPKGERKHYVGILRSHALSHRCKHQQLPVQLHPGLPAHCGGPVVLHPDPLRSGALLRRGHAEGIRQPDPAGQKACQRHELLPGPGHRHRRSGGHRQHRGLRRSHPHRRTGGHLLDVDHRLLRHGHHLR